MSPSPERRELPPLDGAPSCEGEWQPARILVIRLSALGDVLLATPAVRALKRRFPGAQIDWLVEKPYVPLLAGNPYVRPVAYEKRGAHAGLRGLLALREELASRRYDLVVDLQGKPKTRVLRAVGRRGHALRKRSLGAGLLALLGYDPPTVRGHAVDLFVEALAPLGVSADGRQLELRLTEEMKAEARSLLGAAGGAGKWVGLSPGTRWATKKWPVERFAALGRELAARGCRLLLVGGPGDAAELAGLRAGLAGLEVADTASLSVGGLAAALEYCDVLVCGDSGPAHMAAALGVPLVALFGRTSPQRWGPISENARVLRADVGCSPCSNHGSAACPKKHHDCMRKLEVDQVLEATLAALERPAT